MEIDIHIPCKVVWWKCKVYCSNAL
jgi:hypothetical protein